MRNKLPRKRKKALIKSEGSISYMAAQIANEILFEERGVSDFRFPKLKVLNNQIIINGYW
jgi:hypothetical protein